MRVPVILDRIVRRNQQSVEILVSKGDLAYSASKLDR
jgi:hypothetical protein